ncbi:MAG: hypothetical protein HY360_25140 [Verrucomicrobia bacterium]|nr:hypothetical protein [Verrucomicrobiota bacterium]
MSSLRKEKLTAWLQQAYRLTKLFDQLQGCIAGGRNSIPHAAVAVHLGMSEGAVQVAAHRLR